MKKITIILLFVSACLAGGAQNVSIPDANFKSALIANPSIDLNLDGEVQVSEAAAFNGHLDVSSHAISDLTGIEAFTSVTFLNCQTNNLTNLDLSNNPALTFVFCGGNLLSNLNLSANTLLDTLYCEYNVLTSLTVDSGLMFLNCANNHLPGINFSANTALTQLIMNNNYMTTADITNNTALTYFDISYNQLTSLYAKNGTNTSFTFFNCNNNPSLSCIEVDNSTYSAGNANWYKDAGASWSVTCSYAPHAAFTFGPSAICLGANVSCTDASVNSPTSWFWNFGDGNTSTQQNPNYTYTTAGNYTITLTVSNANGSDSTFAAIAVEAPPTVTVGGNTPLCSGDLLNLGASVTGTIASYAWTGPAGFNDNTPAPSLYPTFSGMYTLLVTSTSNCTASDSVYIIVNPLPGLTMAGSGITCAGACDGTDMGNPTGNGPFTFSWSNGPTTQTVTGLCAGVYTLTVTDANGCMATASDPLTEPPALSLNLIANNVSCNGMCNGDATGTASGGAGGYNYTWTPGAIMSPTAMSLCAGTYTCDVTDVNGCTANSTITITEPAAMVVTPSNSNVTCYGGVGAVISLAVSGGVPAYTYNWSQGGTTSSIMNLTAGTYTYSVSDSAGCSATGTVTVTQPTQVGVTFFPSSATCGLSNGSIMASPFGGGSGPYTFLWADGSTGGALNNVPSGQYFVQVSDQYGCTSSATGNVDDANGPSVILNSTTNVSCNGLSDGALFTTISGGAAPLTIQWLNGATTNNISGIPAGVYDLTVTDNSGCTVHRSYTVLEPNPISLSTSSASPSACLNNDGTATVMPSGGTPAYTFLWDAAAGFQTSSTASALTAGAYKVIVTDANGCSDSTYVSVEDPGAPMIMVDSIVQAGCVSAGNIGSGGIYISLMGGSGSYGYAWTNNTANEDATNLGKGIYGVVVTDLNSSCKASVSKFIYGIQPGTPQICLVTVDTATNRNIIIWEKDIPGIQTYKIYRQSSVAGQFNLIATIPADSLSQFEDTLANAEIQPWDYEIRVSDSCGFTSSLSLKHQSIFLTTSQNVGGTVNLNWTPYAGTIFSDYYIYRRGLLSPWALIDSVPSGVTVYADTMAPVDSLDYMIEIKPSNPCSPTRAIVNTSRSNIKSQKVVASGIAAVQETNNTLSVFPNPASDQITVRVQQKQSDRFNIRIINTLGQIVYEKGFEAANINEVVSLKEFANGLYFVQLYSSQELKQVKVIKQK